ncbi:hypothetical protein [Microbispora sp. CA-102843]|uniref:hypothetical protein n=1 Tax=Microbispora sp. CA-102843 TaxID=3239952 RepID=UPI003D94CB6D
MIFKDPRKCNAYTSGTFIKKTGKNATDSGGVDLGELAQRHHPTGRRLRRRLLLRELISRLSSREAPGAGVASSATGPRLR